MFCEVERSYIEDGFNLYGLRACVSNFSDCLDLILDRFGPDDDSDDSQLTQSACSLYGLIHARYILTAHGLDAMYAKVRCSFFVREKNDKKYDAVIKRSKHAKSSSLTFANLLHHHHLLYIFLLTMFFPVRRERVWHMSLDPLRCAAGLARRNEGRTQGRPRPDLLSQVFANLPPPAGPQPVRYFGRCGRGGLWDDLCPFVLDDLFESRPRPTADRIRLHSPRLWLSFAQECPAQVPADAATTRSTAATTTTTCIAGITTTTTASSRRRCRSSGTSRFIQARHAQDQQQ
jgi:Casein kinase II regulatory subunit